MKRITVVQLLADSAVVVAGCDGRGPETGQAIPESSSREQATAPPIAVPDNDRSSQIVQVDLWYDADPHFAKLEAWRSRWQGQIEEASMIGGCDCHVAQFRIRATQHAVDDFPKYDVRFTGDGSPN